MRGAAAYLDSPWWLSFNRQIHDESAAQVSRRGRPQRAATPEPDNAARRLVDQSLAQLPQSSAGPSDEDLLDWLESIRPIAEPIVPRKQAAKRHYGSHPYFTKRAWNVVQTYIENFSRAGDLILDPFGGAGVTAVEALVLGRRAIHVDVAPLANLITWGVAIAPVDIEAFRDEYAAIQNDCESRIRSLYFRSDAEITAMPIPYWYPAGVPLPSNADVDTVADCFHRRSLIALSILNERIKCIQDATIRDLFRLVFGATLNKTNLTFSSTTGRKPSRGDSGIFRVYRYWIPKSTIELNVWEQFQLRYQGWLSAKKETNQVIGANYSKANCRIVQASATDLSAHVTDASVDYIYTDPPYGAHIAYLDLMTMWHAWLSLDVQPLHRQLEVIEGGELRKSRRDYTKLLSASIGEMFRVLKPNHWLSVVFAHKDPGYWHAIVDAAQGAGFEYVNTAVQPSTTPSLHKRKNPLNVLSGELVLNFRKAPRPIPLVMDAVGKDVVELIKNTAELAIVRESGATTEQIYNYLVPVLLENGLLAVARRRIDDVINLLRQDFDFHESDGVWRLRPNTKLGSFVPLEQRIRFYVADFLKRAERERRPATFDDVVLNVMPNLRNGRTPDNQTILSVLRDIAFSQDGVHWELRPTDAVGWTAWLLRGTEALSPLPYASSTSHGEMILRIANLGKVADLVPHVGRKEQSEFVHGSRLGDIGRTDLPDELNLTQWAKGKIEQIDCIWFTAEGEPAYAFEVEASTQITTAIDRFLELLKSRSGLARRVIIVVPSGRTRKLDTILRESHYIGHPLYMETKLAWLYIDDVVRLYDTYAGRKPPTREQLMHRLDGLVRLPKIPPNWR